jgi:hypothetical protein
MNEYEMTVVVRYEFKVQADTWAEANQLGFTYQDYPNMAMVDGIEVAHLSGPGEPGDEE